MKTSLVLFVLIILNTSALLSEPFAQLIKGMETWPLIVFEIILLLAWYINNMLKGLNELAKVDFSGIELFIIKPKNKTQGKP